MPKQADRYVVDFPALFVVPAWIQRHCVIPDGFHKGRPFKMYDWQLWCALNHYRIAPKVQQNPTWLEGDPDAYPVLSAAFVFSHSQVIAPQKTGKGPWAASLVCAEAVGPVLFYDWATEGDEYHCDDHGCGCGWVYRYRTGEPMGMPWPTPLIQLLATSEKQVANVYRPLTAMAKGERLADLMQFREGFIRLPNEGKIETVTSSAKSRLGNPITFCLQDETQLYTESNGLVEVADTMQRGVGAMGGRAIETTNCYDPAEKSTAQITRESRLPDLFKFYDEPPKDLQYRLKADRTKIHAYNYRGSPHADPHGIESKAMKLIEKGDIAQAERFYGNRIVAGLGSWMDGDAWDARVAKAPPKLERRPQVVLGFDGSDTDDWTGIRAETQDGYQFTPTTSAGPTIWDPADHGGKVPRLDVAAAVEELFSAFDVVRMYCDPPYWETEIDTWAEKHGEKKVIRWPTYRPVPMHAALERLLTDVNKADSGFSHDGCATTALHMRNARKAARSLGSVPRYILTKPGDGRKIDLAVSSTLAHEAWGDATNAKLWRKRRYVYSA